MKFRSLIKVLCGLTEGIQSLLSEKNYENKNLANIELIQSRS